MPQSKSWGFPRWGGYGETGEEAVKVQLCEWDGCDEKAEHPAPKYRDSDDRFWFCQQHAGEYNRNWNYFKGLTPEEAEKAAKKHKTFADGFRDANTWDYVDAGLTKEERERKVAFEVLELAEGASDDEIKDAFRRLAKIHHPDANPNDDTAADRFKSVGAAYGILKKQAFRQAEN